MTIPTYSDPLVVYWYTNENTGQKISIAVNNEVGTIVAGRLTMSGIPDEINKVTVSSPVSMTEIKSNRVITSTTQYRVDYQMGIIYFDSDLDGTQVTYDYYSRGKIFMPASRVYYDVDNLGEVDTTVKDKIDTIEATQTADELTFTNHASGSANRHSTNDIDNDSVNVSGANLTNAIDNIDTRIDSHVAGSAEKHGTDEIDNDSGVTGATNTAALNTLKSQMDTLVVGAANTTIGVFSMSGTGVNTITATYATLTYFTGLKLSLTTAGKNTTATTLNINSLGAKSIKIKQRNGSKISLIGGEMPSIAELEYDGTDFLLLNSEKPSVVYAKDEGLVGDNSTNDATALNTLITAIGSTPTDLYFTYGTYKISTNVVFPANINIKFGMGGMLKPANGVSITGTNTKIEAGLHQIFDLSLGGSVSGTWAINRIYPEWYGAVGDGSTDDTDAIQYSINMTSASCRRIYLSERVYIFTTLTLPVDRVVRFIGAGQGVIEGSTPLLNGAVLKRKPAYTGAMFTPTGTSSTANKGAQFYNLSIAGNRVDGNCFEIEWINVMQFDCVTFHRIKGHAIRAYSLYNSWFRNCRFYGCGDSTHEVVLLDGSTASNSATAGVHFFDCTWENNYGTDVKLTRDNAPATAGTSDIKIIGGKIEQSLTSSIPGLPLMIIEATAHSDIKTLFANGMSPTATHLQIGGTANTRIRGLNVDSLFADTETDPTKEPKYLVDILYHASGEAYDINIKGYFNGGGVDTGSQIRVGTLTNSKLTRVFINPANQYFNTNGAVIEGVFSGQNSISGDRGDTAITLVNGLDAETQLFNTEITADRIITLSKVAEGNTNYPQMGAEFNITRNAIGAFNLNVINGAGGGVIKAMALTSWAKFMFNGTDWILSSSGSL
jgi:hypothetical protein